MLIEYGVVFLDLRMNAFTSSASRYSGMRFSRLGAAPSCVLGITSSGSALAGDCGSRVGGHGRTPTLV